MIEANRRNLFTIPKAEISWQGLVEATEIPTLEPSRSASLQYFLATAASACSATGATESSDAAC